MIQNNNRSDISKLKQSFSRCEDEIQKLEQILLDDKPLMPASAYELQRKCGKPVCICVTEGKLHSSWVVTWKKNGRSCLRTIPKDKLEQFKVVTTQYQEFRKLRKRLIEVQQEMVGIIDKIEIKRTVRPENGHKML